MEVSTTSEEEVDRHENTPSKEPVPDEGSRRETTTLLTSIFFVAACGLIYELLIATVSSYFLGNSVTQFSISIGIFIGSMGLGSHLSQFIRTNLLSVFILIEIVLGAVGGLSVCLLFWSYAEGPLYWVVLYGSLGLIGGLTGVELPLLTRVLKRYGSLRTIIARALSFDYLGSLVGSVLFPLLFLPSLGMTRTAFMVGILNVGVAIWNIRVFGKLLPSPGIWGGLSLGTAGILALGFACSFQIVHLLEGRLYKDQIIYAAQTPYQRIVITRWLEDMRLFLDGNIQFCSLDEYRYHEALIHPAMTLPPVVEKVLILGGGDGLAVREILKHRSVKSVTLIDIDPQMTALGKTYPAFIELNQNSLNHDKVKIVNMDAYKFLERQAELYDVIISDLPDPNTDVLAKLYSVQFYELVKRHLSASGVFVAQATSPYFSREAFWCIIKTMGEADLRVVPYHAYVPSFGDWGFVLASRNPIHKERLRLNIPTRFLNEAVLKEMFVLSRDEEQVPVDASTLDHPTILQYYLKASRNWE